MRYQIARIYTGKIKMINDQKNIFENFHLNLISRFQVLTVFKALNIESRQFEKEEELLREREEIMRDLKPFLDLNEKLCEQVAKRTLLMQYGILGGMCVQAGILARLTWFEYSWDIMEPVTYFITYG